MPIMKKKLQKMNCSSRKKFKNEIFLKTQKDPRICFAFLYFKKQDFKKENLMNKPHELILRLHIV